MNNSTENEIRDLARELIVRVHELSLKLNSEVQDRLLERCFTINSVIAQAYANLEDTKHNEFMLEAINELDSLRTELDNQNDSIENIIARETIEELYIEIELAVIPLKKYLMEDQDPKLEKVCI